MMSNFLKMMFWNHHKGGSGHILRSIQQSLDQEITTYKYMIKRKLILYLIYKKVILKNYPLLSLKKQRKEWSGHSLPMINSIFQLWKIKPGATNKISFLEILATNYPLNSIDVDFFIHSLKYNVCLKWSHFEF